VKAGLESEVAPCSLSPRRAIMFTGTVWSSAVAGHADGASNATGMTWTSRVSFWRWA
jgi:hypothetical protein